MFLFTHTFYKFSTFFRPCFFSPIFSLPDFLQSFHPTFFTHVSFSPILFTKFSPMFFSPTLFFTYFFHLSFSHPSFFTHAFYKVFTHIIFSPMFLFHPCFFFTHVSISPMFFLFTHLFRSSIGHEGTSTLFQSEVTSTLFNWKSKKENYIKKYEPDSTLWFPPGRRRIRQRRRS